MHGPVHARCQVVGGDAAGCTEQDAPRDVVRQATLTKSNRGSRPGSADKNSPAGLKGKLGAAAKNAKR